MNAFNNGFHGRDVENHATEYVIRNALENMFDFVGRCLRRGHFARKDKYVLTVGAVIIGSRLGVQS